MTMNELPPSIQTVLTRPTRQDALRHLAAFGPKAGSNYARRRNYDYGPERHEHVSQLSPYIRSRVITESEILRAVLEQHSPYAADKFIQEAASARPESRQRRDRHPQQVNELLACLTSLSFKLKLP